VGSTAFHVLLLGVLALRGAAPLTPAPVGPQVVFVDIAPRPLLKNERPRAPTAAASGATAASSAAGRVVVRFRDPRLDEDEDLTPRPRIAAPVAGAPAPDPWQVRPETEGQAITRSLRNSMIGCDAGRARLTPEDRAACGERFGERAARATPIQGTGDPDRDARFAREGARALAQYEGRRQPLSGSVGVVGPADCVGSNLGTGCAGAHLPSVPGVDMNQGGASVVNPSQRKRLSAD
jgi:hypothetical protein